MMQANEKTEEPEFANDRERWEEAEAQRWERQREYLKTEIMPGWLEKLNADPLNETAARMVYEVNIRAATYQTMVWSLRKSRYSRLEHEAYKAAGLV